LTVPGSSSERLSIVVRGAVQGVGFRPFVYRLAGELGLTGWVRNSSAGVFIEAEGPPNLLKEFRRRLEDEIPPHALIRSLEARILDAKGFADFRILDSEGGARTALILPDLATCPLCVAELFDPKDRRYRYPFINCTHCGPRFSIIERLPYDRPNTTMKRFPMCGRCASEYRNPLDRRFHAQPVACPDCGPRLSITGPDGIAVAEGEAALAAAEERILGGGIVAVKGLGGFHLMVNATDDQAVRRLRDRKRREEKPFAVMVASAAEAAAHCRLSDEEMRLLGGPESPIVLLRRGTCDAARPISPEVAPGNPYLGLLLPYTPLHHLLMKDLDFPVVATSGNLSDEPICIANDEAVARLAGIADAFLLHDRPIARHVDDSIARIVADRELLLRRSRGYAPLPISASNDLPPVLAVGGQLKATIAVSVGREVFLSQHIGDLETVPAVEAFESVVRDLTDMYDSRVEGIVCDSHPDYTSTRFALRKDQPVMQVQHHYAHVLACMVENELEPPLLGVAWDGTGYGTDGTIWGGEFLRIGNGGFQRVASLREFPLPGGETAVREPRRSALGLLFELLGESLWNESNEDLRRPFSSVELQVLRRLLERGLQSPRTSSAGRLFDAVASLLECRQLSSYEGQAAMELEFKAGGGSGTAGWKPYPVQFSGTMDESGPVRLDWGPAVAALIEGRRGGVAAEELAARFHSTLAQSVVEAARISGESRVVLSGGCFQNRLLTELCVGRLRAAGFQPYWHQRVPPNDGGIALGQVMAARDWKSIRRNR